MLLNLHLKLRAQMELITVLARELAIANARSQPSTGSATPRRAIWPDQDEIVAGIVVGDEGVQAEHDERRRCVEQQVAAATCARPERRPIANSGTRTRPRAADPHAAPAERDADQQMPPPVRAHLVENDPGHDRIETDMLLQQVHRDGRGRRERSCRGRDKKSGASNRCRRPCRRPGRRARHAIRKCANEFRRRHVVVGEPFDQTLRSRILRSIPTFRPKRDCERSMVRRQRRKRPANASVASRTRIAALRASHKPFNEADDHEDWEQDDEGRPRQAEQSQKQAGEREISQPRRLPGQQCEQHRRGNTARP